MFSRRFVALLVGSRALPGIDPALPIRVVRHVAFGGAGALDQVEIGLADLVPLVAPIPGLSTRSSRGTLPGAVLEGLLVLIASLFGHG
jgi:hypothetical protein